MNKKNSSKAQSKEAKGTTKKTKKGTDVVIPLSEYKKVINHMRRMYAELTAMRAIIDSFAIDPGTSTTYNNDEFSNAIQRIDSYAQSVKLSDSELLKFIKHLIEKLLEKKKIIRTKPEKVGYVMVDLLKQVDARSFETGFETNNGDINLLFCRVKRSDLDGFVPYLKSPYYNTTILYAILGILIHYGYLEKDFAGIIRSLESIPFGERGSKKIDTKANKFKHIVKFDSNGGSYIDYESNYYFSPDTIHYIESCCKIHLDEE
jgi:hypothetical protein